MTQDTLFPVAAPPPAHRVESLARVIAGFGWPEREAFARLTKQQQEVAREAARLALVHVAAHQDPIVEREERGV